MIIKLSKEETEKKLAELIIKELNIDLDGKQYNAYILYGEFTLEVKGRFEEEKF